MSAVLNPSPWTLVCPVNDIVPNTGVCALVDGHPVAVFRVITADGRDAFYAIDNIDPKNGANVLSRGLVGNLGEHLVVASPLYKHHLVLATGECLENPAWSVRAHHAEVRDGQVWVSLG
ncbi:nitrite reductase small subunit NirD [Aquabacterium fontiphilum]|jgi:nitrite reductase (NADH) small subunit|uniref:nitrite reductase small subunit NirD n=1 Tax=Aquabacterium fontiphilum TaxID=450365 RepID=UPI001377319E|nr:nitrite reductase small subunit NirD [Aquabacterium fontiphilum]NBD19073.1 nitrite reductase small subunit NirD [Aquabacterium fontiphilum]